MTDEQAPKSPADPRPGNRPYYQNPNCDICDTPLVLADVFKGETENIWYDEFICPNHPEEGVVMDWPQPMIERLRGRSFEMEMEPDKVVPLADLRPEGGFKFEIHPSALAEMKKAGISVDEIVSVINEAETKRAE